MWVLHKIAITSVGTYTYSYGVTNNGVINLTHHTNHQVDN